MTADLLNRIIEGATVDDKRGVRTRCQWLALHSGCPAASVRSAWHLEELSRDLDVVRCIIYDLHTAFAWVILSPGIS